MSLYEIGLLASALFGTLGLLAFVSMFYDSGSWRVFFGFALITGLCAGLAHINSENGYNHRDIIPTISKAFEMVRGPIEE